MALVAQVESSACITTAQTDQWQPMILPAEDRSGYADARLIGLADGMQRVAAYPQIHLILMLFHEVPV